MGGPEVIEIIAREVRAPAANEVRIEVKAAAINPTDLLLRDPKYRSNLVKTRDAATSDPATSDPATRAVPGMDLAGIVESVGPGVARVHVGDRVMASVSPRRPEGGAQQQYVVAPAASVVALPDGASFAEACTLPMNGLTALLALEKAGLEKGQVFAVSGGAGLLAHYAIAAAKERGLKVISDARPAEIALVKSYGADIVVERGPRFANAIRAALPVGADALLDTAVLGETSFGALREGGIYLPVRGWGDTPSERQIQIKKVFVHEVLERTEWLEELRALVLAGKIKLRVAGEYTPERTGDAQRALEAGGVRGRPVILF